jgi:hypothetical protein
MTIVGLAASYVVFSVVCVKFVGWKYGLFLGSIAIQWLRGLGKLEEFEAEVISGFQPCSSFWRSHLLREEFLSAPIHSSSALWSPNPVLHYGS